ncbi:MAG: hypothetical protein V4515_14695 [Chloroflexota bacterium]
MSWLSGPCRDGEDEIRTVDDAEVQRRIESWRTYDDAVEAIEEAARWPNRQDD